MWFSPVSSTNKADRHDITETIVESGTKTPQTNPNLMQSLSFICIDSKYTRIVKLLQLRYDKEKISDSCACANTADIHFFLSFYVVLFSTFFIVHMLQIAFVNKTPNSTSVVAVIVWQCPSPPML